MVCLYGKFHDPWSRDPCTRAWPIRHIRYFFKNQLLYFGAWFRKTLCIVMMTNKGFIKLLDFMYPGQVHISHIMKMQYVFSSSFLLWAWRKQIIKFTVMMNKGNFTKIVNCMPPFGRGSAYVF